MYTVSLTEICFDFFYHGTEMYISCFDQHGLESEERSYGVFFLLVFVFC